MKREPYKITLKKQREKSVLDRHPWLFRSAIANPIEDIPPGSAVEVYSADGSFLAHGTYNPKSQVAIKLWSFNKDEPITYELVLRKISNALNIRRKLLKDTNAFKLFFSESDGIPGLIADIYDDLIVCQFLTLGVHARRGWIINALKELLPDCAIYERQDKDAQKLEGFVTKDQFHTQRTVKNPIVIEENGLKFYVDFIGGHKTGFYLDQRDNRLIFSEYVKDRSVLNCFSYTGAFTVYALKHGAKKVTNIDISQSALDLLDKNIRLNELNPSKSENIHGDVFDEMRRLLERGVRYDVIVLDPPKFVHSKAHLDSAIKGYKDINMIAMKLLKPDGLLFTFSCSGLMSPDLFEKVVAFAALDANRTTRIVRTLTQAPDHPILTSFLEARYLKGLICTVS